MKKVPSLADEIPFRYSAAASRTIAALLPSLPNPDASIHFLNRLIAEAPDAARKVTSDQHALRYALTVFSYSRFLADAVIRYPQWLLEMAAARDLHRGFLAEQYEDLLIAALPPDGQ